MDTLSEYQASILKSLAQPTRIRIINCMRDGEKSVLEICSTLRQQRSNVSRHLCLMHMDGVLKRHDKGLNTIYEISCPEVLQILDLTARILVHSLSKRVDGLKSKTLA